MDGFQVYKEYLSLKWHFTRPTYNHLTKGAVRFSRPGFESRRDKYSFDKLAKYKNPAGMILANILVNPNIWIGDIVSPEGVATFTKWLATRQSLTYIFKNEVGSMVINGDFNQELSVIDGQLPSVVRQYLGGSMHLEVVVILGVITKAMLDWEKKLVGNPIWDNIALRITKYNSFLRWDKAIYRQIVVDTIKQLVYK